MHEDTEKWKRNLQLIDMLHDKPKSALKMKKTLKYFYFLSEYKGERYFAIVYLDDYPVYALQVCLTAGECKRGRAHNFGIMRMSYVSVLSNYAFSDDFKPSTKLKWDKALKKVYHMVKNADVSMITLGNKKIKGQFL